MMSRVLYSTALGLTIAALAAAGVNAQDNIRERVKAIARADWETEYPKDTPGSTPLLVHDLPELTEQLISLQSKERKTRIGPNIEVVTFFRVTLATYSLRNSEVVAEHYLLDRDDPYWTVAVDSTGGIYKLEGFPDHITGFNQLLKKLNLKIKDTSDADWVFDTYLKACRPEEYESSIVVDEMTLQATALRDFRIRFSAPENRIRYDRWLKSLTPRIKKQVASPRIVKQGDGFAVTFNRYDKGSIIRESLVISNEGLVAAGKITKIK